MGPVCCGIPKIRCCSVQSPTLLEMRASSLLLPPHIPNPSSLPLLPEDHLASYFTKEMEADRGDAHSCAHTSLWAAPAYTRSACPPGLTGGLSQLPSTAHSATLYATPITSCSRQEIAPAILPSLSCILFFGLFWIIPLGLITNML